MKTLSPEGVRKRVQEPPIACFTIDEHVLMPLEFQPPFA
jgi:hypothetical protein